MDWTKTKLYEGWNTRRDASGYTLSARFYAASRDDLPVRGDRVPSTGINAVPPRFISYVISQVDVTQATAAGPFLASVTAQPWINSLKNDTSDSLLRQANYTCSYTDYKVPLGWSKVGLNDAAEYAARQNRYDTYILTLGKTDERRMQAEQLRAAWLAYQSCPFKKPPAAKWLETNIRMLNVLATFYTKDNDGLEFWGRFDGVVPVSSFPDWLQGIPGGDDRWRLVDEVVEHTYDTDGKTPVFKVSRTLLGIPSSFTDIDGDRMRWDDAKLGQRNWEDGMNYNRFNRM